MHPILWQTGGWTLYSFTVCLNAGLVLGLFWWWWENGHGQHGAVTTQKRIDVILWSALLALIGARLGYVIAHWAYFRERPTEALVFWHGGLAFHGGLITGLVALWLLSKRQQLCVRSLGDSIVLPLLAGQILGWLGNLLSGSAYGQVGSSAADPFLFYWPDIYGVKLPRFPTQAVGILASLALLAILLGVRMQRPPAGTLLALYLVLYGGVHFGIELTRGDETWFWGPWRAAQWLDVGMIISGLILFFGFAIRTHNSRTASS